MRGSGKGGAYELIAAFKFLDRNGSGLLDERGMMSGMKRFNLNIPDKAVKEYLRGVSDREGFGDSGMINYHAFVAEVMGQAVKEDNRFSMEQYVPPPPSPPVSSRAASVFASN